MEDDNIAAWRHQGRALQYRRWGATGEAEERRKRLRQDAVRRVEKHKVCMLKISSSVHKPATVAMRVAISLHYPACC
jgi:hypothetical protein